MAMTVAATGNLLKQVTAAWGNPERVLEAGMNELFRHLDLFDMDLDDQVRYSGKLGVLAGRLAAEGSPEQFVQEFESSILNDE